MNSDNLSGNSNPNLMSCLQIGKLLTSTLDLNEILELIMTKISQLVEADNWSLFLRDEETGDLKFEVVVGLDKEKIKDIRIPAGKGIAGMVAQSGEPLYLSDASNDPRVYREIDRITGFTTKSIICIPLKIHGRILGVIEIINVENMEDFKRTKIPLLSALIDYAAIAIENSQYTSRIQHMSITDEYTGLYNARYMHQILPDLLLNAEKNNKRLSVVFMDVDNFKTVVDTYGHLSGSMVLKEIGQTISDQLTPSDILIKYGGDEYVLILPNRDKTSAMEITKKIQQAVRNSTYLKSEKYPIKVTASFGLAVFPEDAQNKKDLLIKADTSMYRIKKTTKNGIGTS